jgi:dihydrofolate reductase
VITLIAAIGRNNEIGYNNQLLWNVPEDMQHFKSYTMGKVVIMGRRTFESIGRALPGRKTIVVSSRDINNTAIRAPDIDAALSVEHCYPELVIIGGETVYRQTIDLADKLVITHIDSTFTADAFFPKIDLKVWKINKSVESKDDNYNYRFVEYIRNENIGDSN